VVGEEGGDIVSVTKPKRVTVPTFEIVSNPMIPITQIKERRFDLVARSLNLAKAEVGAQEDQYVFQLFDGVAVAANAAAGTNTNDPIYNIDQTITAPISVAQMADSFAQVTRHDLSIAYVFFNPRDYADLLSGPKRTSTVKHSASCSRRALWGIYGEQRFSSLVKWATAHSTFWQTLSSLALSPSVSLSRLCRQIVLTSVRSVSRSLRTWASSCSTRAACSAC